jgi:hypothetical protein
MLVRAVDEILGTHRLSSVAVRSAARAEVYALEEQPGNTCLRAMHGAGTRQPSAMRTAQPSP